MTFGHPEGIEELKDPDAMAAHVLSQHEDPASYELPTARDTAPRTRNTKDPEAPRKAPRSTEPSSFKIVPPAVSNPNDYEYLPGHFVARRILDIDSSTAKEPLYTVRLQSGERETMTHNRFMDLGNSTKALDQYTQDSGSDDDIMLVGQRPLSYRPLHAGDGPASDGSYSDTRTRHTRTRRNLSRPAARGGYLGFYQNDPSSRDSEESSTDELTDARLHTRKPRQGARRAGKRGLRRGPRPGLRSTRPSSSDEYSPLAKATRVSARDRKSLRQNLRERYEDDVSEFASDTPKKQKYTGAKETFQITSHDDEFRQRHFACCDTCSYYEDDSVKGPLVFCQGCSTSYHQTCLGPRNSREHLVTKIDEGHFILQCRRCLGVAHKKHDMSPHLGECANCHELGPMSRPLRQRLTSKEEQQQRVANYGMDPVTPVDRTRVNNIDNLLFRCTGCHRGFHVECLKPMTNIDTFDNFSDYSVHWQCNECSNAPGDIQEILAWRLIERESMGSNIPHSEIIPEVKKEYLIKWKRKSYFRVAWMPGDWVYCISSPTTRRSFLMSDSARKPTWTTEDAVSEDKLRVDVVFEVTYRENTVEKDKSNPEMVKEAYVKYKGLNYEDTVWEKPPEPNKADDKDRWADFSTAFNDWLARGDISIPDRNKLNERLALIRTKDFEQDLVMHTQSDMITGGDLMAYQLDGVNWLYYMFVRQQNAILADDMGLGKTIQVIGLLTALIQKHSCWPFLVVCPNSTVPNWRREIKNWAPSLQVATYFGTQYSRQMARDYEMFPQGGRDLHCHVVIASYESMIDDDTKRVLNKVPWAGLVVDEGQRLKNDRSQLYEKLCRMKFDFKVLLSGTPLQNNIRELFNLLQFLDRDKNAEELEKEYSSLDSGKIRTLHELIRPFFLRRTKAEVLPFLPPMVQIIVPVSMSLVQKKLYKSILGKNPQLIRAIVKKQTGQIRKQDRHNLNNILMQLRKCLCHPFIYNRAIEEYTSDSVLAQRHLVEASGKLRLLNLMLPRLQERGHRVLIFSQFLENLDVVEDFLHGLGLKYGRLDGRLSAKDKQQQIDQFNQPGSPIFAFLLSTRSGGVGINLATADTVIIMDPDFNPKQDMQALSRAHRIGQQKTVLVFHLTTRASVEEKIMLKGKKKLALDHVLIERMEADEDEEDLESILQHGAASLFDDDDSADIHYDLPSIDKLLDRSQVEKKEQSSTNDSRSTEQPKFNFARVWQNDRGTLEEVAEETEEIIPADVAAWEKILRERERDANEEEYSKLEGLGRGKRKRATVNYQTTREEGAEDHDILESSPVKRRGKSHRNDDSDVEFREGRPESESADDEDAGANPMDMDLHSETPPRPKARPFERVQMPPNAIPSSLDGALDPHPYLQAGPTCLACGQPHYPGACPLKQAGVEHCPLCGLAHFGKRRACPHLQSPTQIHRMLDALSKSKEDPKLVAMATKYLRVIFTSEAQRQRLKAAMAAGAVQHPGPTQRATSSSLQAPPMSAFVPARVPQQGLPPAAQHLGGASAYIDLTGPDSSIRASNNTNPSPAPTSTESITKQLPPQ
ncbi:hypothetical protein N7448_004755 [Penicillium atrosanguineum]|uniref:Chromatin remodeling complex subunit n=1 Tax=Penicillium atrosanguineum TaxID=1132637 RepID=A0A9W9PPR6_9EURO|nr:hypothetical protein N7448_004755 [Penicillium atrosanguineum]KAJ5303426.1 hypothetical protein N7476_010225 [Penicillium atrosanguineum]